MYDALGLELFAPDHPSAAVTAIVAPKGLDSGVIVKEFRQKFGSIINNGQGEMKGRIFRIAHLGYFDVVDLFGIVAQLELILDANGFPGGARQTGVRRRAEVLRGECGRQADCDGVVSRK